MRWRARTIVHLHCALRASRPQLKRDPLGASPERVPVISRPSLSAGLLAFILCCDSRPAADSARVERAAASESSAAEDTAGCDLARTNIHAEPLALVREYLQNDADGQFTSSNAWKTSARFCPGHEPGWDGATLITAYKLEPVSSGVDTAKYRVTYDVYGSLDQDSAGFFVAAALKQVIDTFVTVRTPFGWRISAPVLDPHVLPHGAIALTRFHERDRRLLDSLRSRE